MDDGIEIIKKMSDACLKPNSKTKVRKTEKDDHDNIKCKEGPEEGVILDGETEQIVKGSAVDKPNEKNAIGRNKGNRRNRQGILGNS
jgi:hypothetical protein